MNLTHALRIKQDTRLALVGAGGKTSALFTLAREAEGPVFLAAATHLAVEQAALASRHYTIQNAADWEKTLPDIPYRGAALFTGPLGHDQRLSGLSFAALEDVATLASARGVPLFLEADGSRRLPLKAPAEHEPVIPPWVTDVVVVAGLSGLGQPLDAVHVHRPERFALLSGISVGQQISAEALRTVLVSPQGGRKAIPPSARVSVLLNQADVLARQGIDLLHFSGQMRDLLGDFQAVILASLAEGVIFTVESRVAGVILAAGGAQRFGQAKLLLDWRGKPVIWHAVRSAIQAGLSPVVVVAGSEEENIRAALLGMPVEIVSNPDWRQGQSTSIRHALSHLKLEADAAVFLLGDQPLVPPSAIRQLRQRHSQTLAPIIAPVVGGKRANPVLFDRAAFTGLQAITGDRGGRALFDQYPVETIPMDNPGLLFDIDTPEDYAHLLALRETDE